MRADGDIWELVEQTARVKGWDSCWVSWVKGHATEEHIRDGLVDKYDAMFHEQADLAADEGVGQLPEVLRKYVEAIRDRQARYIALVTAIQLYMTDILVAAGIERRGAGGLGKRAASAKDGGQLPAHA